ncbi:ABC transporter substrate-binding protein [Oceanobacter mangrovi]|uniref:ABC transporter substrate-binding protein n=1 Tax=Oceanobacter mangrovi TaxID=2862510 RepID=UPI001FE5164E|nr:ABC transporter substrate-binding protein [Oceanobacter mangrovi]
MTLMDISTAIQRLATTSMLTCKSRLANLAALTITALTTTALTTATTVLLATTSQAAELQTIQIGYLELQQQQSPLLSNVLPDPEDNGLQGARLGRDDNNAGGKFLGLQYQLQESRSYQLDDLKASLQQWQTNGMQAVLVNAPADALQQLSLLAPNLLLFNIGSNSDELRSQTCLNNVLHTLPSRAMLTDALAQWLISKKLKKWLLITGTRPGDKLYADAVRRSAKRFGGKLVAEKDWTFDADLRRSAAAEVPLFTQTKEYDAVIVADEPGDFGEFILYNTWYPRPVVGTQGLTPTGWHRVVEQWGAAQLQNRFDRLAHRWMTDKDYAAWAAMRSIGETLAHQQPYAAAALKDYLLGPDFELAGFKGRKLTYRNWNGQLRQPIPLIHPRALVSQSPQEGYLHPTTELDTLGFDKPESQCRIGS